MSATEIIDEFNGLSRVPVITVAMIRHDSALS
jgi:hypothetical protein